MPEAWPAFDEVMRVLTLRAGHNSAVVVLAATLLGIAAGAIGSLALLRKRAMMGDCLAHCTLPGICTAFLATVWLGGEGRSLPVLLLGATASGILGVLCVQGIIRYTRLKEDAAIASVLSVFFGIGIVLLSSIQSLATGNQGGLSHFIYGQTAAMSIGDAAMMGGAAMAAFMVSALLFKEFRLVCFDDRFAAAIGVRVGVVDLLMMALVVLVTVIGLQAVGLVLIVAMLIIPAAAARFWTERFGRVFVLSGVIGGVSGYLGSTASALLPRLPAGAVIVLTAGALFLVCMTLAPSRGVAAGTLRHLKLRLRIATDHYLRAMYEAAELGGAVRREVPIAAMAEDRGWPEWAARGLTWWLTRRGLIVASAGNAAFTERGLSEGRRITRNHRLWEEFLVTHAHLAASHVDRSADLVEHSLSQDVVAELEATLRERGTLPAVPPSVHPIGGPRV
jgi:manganese/zinc/iron transport system permease protein